MKKAWILFFWFLVSSWQSMLWSQELLPDEVLITYSCYQKPLKLVLKDLAAISEVSIVYSENKIPGNSPVSCQAKNEKIGDILLVLLKPLGFQYQLIGNQLLIVKTHLEGLQNEYIISGYVRDTLSKEYLIGAAVYVHDFSRGTYTNEYGFFSLKLPRAQNRLLFSYLGYKPLALQWYMDADSIMDVFLKPEDLVLNEVLVKEPTRDYFLETPSNQRVVNMYTINKGNHLMGESDPFRFLTVLPNVQSGADGIGGLNVRGGSYDQNLVLLDGVPVYNSGHALGIFSIFNSSAIKNVTLIDGAIPARYAGRLSSVIDVQTKDGNMEKTSGEANLSLLSLKAGVEGPLIKNKLSYHISARRTFLDIWLNELARFIGQEAGTTAKAGYYFYDLNGKIHWRINQKNRLIFNLYRGGDDFNNSSLYETDLIRDFNESALQWGNAVYSARWSSQWNNNTFSKITAYSTNYQISSYKNYSFSQRFARDTLQDFWAYLYKSNLFEKGIKADIDWVMNPKHFFRLGAGYIFRGFQPGTLYADRLRTPDLVGQNLSIGVLEHMLLRNIKNFQETFVYVEDEWNINNYMTLHAGTHVSSLFWSENEKPYISVQPRIGLLMESEKFQVKLGLSNMYQYMHLLSNSGLGLPTDVWLGAGKNMQPQNAWIYTASSRYVTKNQTVAKIEVYYKKMNNLTQFKEGEPVDIQAGVAFEELIPKGKGEAYGVEASIEKNVGKTNFIFSYAYNISNRTFDNINLGNTYPFTYNRSHAVKAYVYRKLSDFSDFSLTWTFGTGNYYTRPENIIIDINGKVTLLYEEKNNAKFEPYHRLDTGFGFYNKFSWGKTRFFIGVYNLYNRRNFYYSDISRNKQNPDLLEINNYSLLPLTPNISYTVTF